MIQINMKMPENCAECPLMADEGDYPYCRALQENSGYTFRASERRFPNCPLKDVTAKPPVHIHEEYPEHDWERDEDGKIDWFALDYGFHNGPGCSRCNYSFCIHCDPNGWNKRPCVIDEYRCPSCGKYVCKGTRFCDICGQGMTWDVD